MRRDALERREALIRAAAACFGEAGYAVPLEDIADRAGVGRGTLYRNFKDRMALVLAIFQREVDRLEERLDPTLSIEATMMQMVLEGMKPSALFARLAAEVSLGDDDLAAFGALGDRLEGVLHPAVERAKAAGEVRGDITAAHVLLATRMMNGLMLRGLPEDEMRAQIAQAIDLLLTGFRPR